MNPRHWLLFFCLTACAAPTPSPLLNLKPCYEATTQSEYERLLKLMKKNESISVRGKKYTCLNNAVPVEPACYVAKTKKEFAKLSREQDQHPERPLKIGGKLYRCIQNIQ